jgi:hypothetical protein
MTKRKPTKHEDDVRRGLRTDQYNGIIDTQLKTIDDLKAEVERLRKAGDAMAEVCNLHGHIIAIQKWGAAKEGKPSV